MYLIAGATSVTGRRVVARLLEASSAVRVMVRSDADATHFRELGVEVAQADVQDRPAVAGACRGVGTVVSLIGRHFAGSEEGLWEVDAKGNENLVQAAVEAGVERFVLLSALWAERDLPPRIFRAKRHAEEALMQSGLPFTILRPATFVVGPSSLVGILGPTIERYGIAFVPAPDSGPVSFIAEQDVAAALVAAALAGDSSSRVYELGGPERLTLAEGARRIAGTLGRRVRLVRVPRAALRVSRALARVGGFGPYEAVLFLEMLAEHGFHCDAAPTRDLLGREPLAVNAALEEYYASGATTPWRESIYGALLRRS